MTRASRSSRAARGLGWDRLAAVDDGWCTSSSPGGAPPAALDPPAESTPSHHGPRAGCTRAVATAVEVFGGLTPREQRRWAVGIGAQTDPDAAASST
jgi:hypothetical protein